MFSQLEVEHPELFNVNTTEGKNFINSYIGFIKLERKQIENAFYKGIQEQQARALIQCEVTTPEQYYNIKYK